MTNEHKPLRFRVRYGYRAGEMVTITDGPDLERALYAMMEHVPVSLAGRVIHGRTILSIEPDYHHYTGWHPTYEPKVAADWMQIERDCPPRDRFELALQGTRLHVQNLVEMGKVDQIGLSHPRATPVERLE